jgi:hypothetical protein
LRELISQKCNLMQTIVYRQTISTQLKMTID